MKSSLSGWTAAASLWLLSGCSPQPVPVDALSFPVILITGASATSALPYRTELVLNRGELGLMAQETYARVGAETGSDHPIVIDATATAFDMKDIVGTHGAMWMMMNPTARMPIRFTLSPRKESGIEAARALVAKSSYMGRDIDPERTKRRIARIRDARSMAEIMRIVDEVPVSDGEPRPHPFEPNG